MATITEQDHAHKMDFLRILQLEIYRKSQPIYAQFDEFRCEFGCSPSTCLDIFHYITGKFIRGEIEHDELSIQDFRKIHILYALRLMWTYEGERRLAKMFATSRTNFKKWSVFVIYQIYTMSFLVVSHI